MLMDVLVMATAWQMACANVQTAGQVPHVSVHWRALAIVVEVVACVSWALVYATLGFLGRRVPTSAVRMIVMAMALAASPFATAMMTGQGNTVSCNQHSLFRHS